MARNKPLTPSQYRKATERHLKGQQRLLKGKAATKTAKARAAHYGHGDKLVKQVSTTLRKVAATHPNPNAKKQAKLALKKLREAQNAFGTASMCQGSANWDSQ